MHFNRQDIEGLEKIKRLNLINSLTGIKPANLIGTISKDGNPNLAIFSSVIHIGSNPALFGFILRPKFEVRRHSYENIMGTGYFTINHIHRSFIEKAHYTSAKFEKGISEFESCKLTEEYIEAFPAPFVKESILKLGLKFEKEIPIELNNTALIIGSIEHIFIPKENIQEKGDVFLDETENIGISGLNHYYSLNKLESFPYARPEDLPAFD